MIQRFVAKEAAQMQLLSGQIIIFAVYTEREVSLVSFFCKNLIMHQNIEFERAVIEFREAAKVQTRSQLSEIFSQKSKY